MVYSVCNLQGELTRGWEKRLFMISLEKNLVVLVVSYASEVAQKYYLTDRTDTLIVRITF